MAKEKKEKKEKKAKLKSEKAKIRDRYIRILKIGLLICALFLIIIYFLLRIVYEQGAFTISLDQNFSKKSGIIIYEHLAEKESRRILEAEKLEFVDNISINWLPDNINDEGEGAHNGDNYIAYTFYVENQGIDTLRYWSTIYIDDVIKNVDEAIRVMVYRNGERTVYAKSNRNGNAESETTPFKSDQIVMLQSRDDFKVGDIDKYTIVIWVEGDDPDCIDALIGGEMKMHMEITEEHIE